MTEPWCADGSLDLPGDHFMAMGAPAFTETIKDLWFLSMGLA
ncbi:MAG: hypothetical protein WCF33_20760 [Pseudonocardiaceae bacterium]